MAGNGASSSSEGSMSGRGTVSSVSDFLVLGLLLEVLLRLVATTASFDSD
jgi:hypothetical protein